MGVPVRDITEYNPDDHDFKGELEQVPAIEADDSFLDEAAATAQRRMEWLEARGVPETDVLQDKDGEFYYDADEENGRVHYMKRRLPEDITLIF